jgi:hypothetical protein
VTTGEHPINPASILTALTDDARLNGLQGSWSVDAYTIGPRSFVRCSYELGSHETQGMHGEQALRFGAHALQRARYAVRISDDGRAVMVDGLAAPMPQDLDGYLQRGREDREAIRLRNSSVETPDPKRAAGREAADASAHTWQIEESIRSTRWQNRGSVFCHACQALVSGDRMSARVALQAMVASWGSHWAHQAREVLARDDARQSGSAHPTQWVEYDDGRKHAA